MRKYICIINIFDLLIVFLSLVSFISLIALVFGLFNPTICFLLGFVVLLLMCRIYPDLFLPIKTDFSLVEILSVAFLLALAFLFRQEPFLYIMGGQDQGIYVNMSAYFQREGRIEIHDPLVILIEEPELLSIYDRLGIFYQPGIYKTDKLGKYAFQFYHLFPIWMAIFGDLFGDINRYYALTFFSLLSVFAIYLLVKEITRSYSWGTIAGIFLALNPLHAFFSRWPVTEVPTLCFSLLGFYYLVRFFNICQIPSRRDYLNLALSAICFGLLFFTRISGFMYVPFFLFILFFSPFSNKEDQSKALVIYVVAIIVFFGISVWYGLSYSRPYSLAIYQISFSKILGQEWQQPLFIFLIILSAFFAFWLMVSLKSLRMRNWFSGQQTRIIKFSWWLLSLIGFFAVLLGIYKAYLFGFTDHYASNNSLVKIWNLWGQGWKSIGQVSLFVAITYISPMLFLLLVGISWSLQKSVPSLFLWSFFIIFLAYICLLQWNIPYQYYYARYLLSEVVPYAIVCSVVGLSLLSSSIWRKTLVTLIIVTTLPYYIYYLVPQSKGREGVAQYTALSEISRDIDKNDIIVFEGNDPKIDNSDPRITTPLVYYFNKKLFSVFNANLTKVAQWAVMNPAIDKVFLLTRNAYNESFLSPIKAVEYKEDIFETVNWIPVRFITNRKYNIYLFEITEDILKINDSYSRYFNIKNNFGVKIEGFHTDHTWTTGDFKIYLPNIDLTTHRNINILTYGYLPKAVQTNSTIKVSLNKIPVNFVENKDNIIVFSLPEQLRKKQSQVIIEGRINTWIPKDISNSQDVRELGLDIKAIEFR